MLEHQERFIKIIESGKRLALINRSRSPYKNTIWRAYTQEILVGMKVGQTLCLASGGGFHYFKKTAIKEIGKS